MPAQPTPQQLAAEQAAEQLQTALPQSAAVVHDPMTEAASVGPDT
jgi:hypothetical protein